MIFIWGKWSGFWEGTHSGLDPGYEGAYHDRGLAHSNIREYRETIDDFIHSINAKKKISSRYQACVNRAKNYANNNQFDEAINYF